MLITFYTVAGSDEIRVVKARPEDLNKHTTTVLATVEIPEPQGRHPDRRLSFEAVGLAAFKAGMQAGAKSTAN